MTYLQKKGTMENIYNLAGKLLQNFQQLEKSLALLAYYRESQGIAYLSGCEQLAVNNWHHLNEETVNAKVASIQNFLDFHNVEVTNLFLIRQKKEEFTSKFFVDNNFDSDNIDMLKEQLNHWIDITNNANDILLSLIRHY